MTKKNIKPCCYFRKFQYTYLAWILLVVLQALRASQQRIEELEESLRSRSEVLEMLQQELNSADQQKQVSTTRIVYTVSCFVLKQN